MLLNNASILQYWSLSSYEIFVFKLFNFAIKCNANLPNSHMKLYCRVEKNGSWQEE